MTKQQMLHEMDKRGWSHETDEKSTSVPGKTAPPPEAGQPFSPQSPG